MDTQADEKGKTEHVQATVEDLGPCKKKLSISIEAARISDEFRTTYKKLGETVPVAGFRPGHVPRRLLEKKFGDQVKDDVRATLVPDAFEEAMKANELVAIGEPEIDVDTIEIEDGEPLSFEVTVEVRPTFELGEYKGLEARAETVEVTDEDVEKTVREILKDRATLVPAEDVSKEGDLLVVDATIRVGGEDVQTEENVHYSLPREVLMGLRVREAPEKLSGRRAGDEETFALKLPDDYKHEEHRGADAELAVSIQEVKRLRVPELDDELARELDFDDAEDLRDEVRSQVRRDKERAAERALETKLIDEILEATPFDLPEGLVQKELDRAMRRARVDLQMAGKSEVEIAEEMTMLQSESEERVKREFREALVLEAIAEKERIFVTETEVRDRVTAIGAAYGRSYEEMHDYLEAQDSLSTMRARMREEKVREFVRRRARIDDNK